MSRFAGFGDKCWDKSPEPDEKNYFIPFLIPRSRLFIPFILPGTAALSRL